MSNSDFFTDPKKKASVAIKGGSDPTGRSQNFGKMNFTNVTEYKPLTDLTYFSGCGLMMASFGTIGEEF